MKFSIISNASSKTIFQVYFHIFGYFQIYTRQMKNLLSRKFTAAVPGKRNTTRISIISSRLNSFAFVRLENISKIFEDFFIIFSNRNFFMYLLDDVVPVHDLDGPQNPVVIKKNFPGFNLLPFRFQIFHNSSPSI